MFQVTRYPMISKTESGRKKEIPGSGSGSGTRWALVVIPTLRAGVFLRVQMVDGWYKRGHYFQYLHYLHYFRWLV